MRKRTLAIALAALAVAGLAGGAYAAGQSSSPSPARSIAAAQRAFINDTANRLHLTPARLEAALKGALIDRIDAGRLPSKVAQAIKQRIEHGSGLLFGPGLVGLGLFGPGAIHAQVIAPRGAAAPSVLLGPPALLTTGAARYLGLSDAALLKQLKAGKSLAQIAQAQGRSKAGLERAMSAAYASALAKAAKAGRLPRGLERHLVTAFNARIEKIVSVSGLPGPPAQIQRKVGPAGPPPFLGGLLGLLPPRVIRFYAGPRARPSWAGPAGP